MCHNFLKDSELDLNNDFVHTKKLNVENVFFSVKRSDESDSLIARTDLTDVSEDTYGNDAEDEEVEDDEDEIQSS